MQPTRTPRADATPAPVAASTGQPAAPGRVVADPQVAERALERSLLRRGALLQPAWSFEVTPSHGYSHSSTANPTVVTVGGVTGVAGATRERDQIDAQLDFRLGLPFDAQLDLSMPHSWAWTDREVTIGGGPFSDTEGNGSGAGDPWSGISKVLLREDGWWPDVIGRVVWDNGLGERTDDGVALGGGFQSLSGSLSFVKRQDPGVFVGSVGYTTSFEEDGLDLGDGISLQAGYALAVSPETSLFFGLNGMLTEEAERNGVELPGSDTTQISLELGLGTIVTRNVLLNVNAGIGITEDAADFSLGLSRPIRF